MSMFRTGDSVASKPRQPELDDGKHYRARLGFMLMPTDLANRAQVSLLTVRNFEKGQRTPIANNLQAIQRAIEDAGMILVFDDESHAVGIHKTAD